MSCTAVYANFFDASSLVKVYTHEPGSEIVRDYFGRQPTKYTTPFCFYEALGVLKVKWLYRKEITKNQYLNAAFELSAWYGASSSSIKDLDFTSPTTFSEARRLADKTSLDLSDAFQILSIKTGYFAPLVGDSQTVLVTADKGLAAAARSEGVHTWYFVDKPAPDQSKTCSAK